MFVEARGRKFQGDLLTTNLRRYVEGTMLDCWMFASLMFASSLVFDVDFFRKIDVVLLLMAVVCCLLSVGLAVAFLVRC